MWHVPVGLEISTNFEGPLLSFLRPTMWAYFSKRIIPLLSLGVSNPKMAQACAKCGPYIILSNSQPGLTQIAKQSTLLVFPFLVPFFPSATN